MILLFMPSGCLIVSSRFDKVISIAAAASYPGISTLSCLGGRAYSRILPLSIHPDLEGHRRLYSVEVSSGKGAGAGLSKVQEKH